MKDIQIFFSSLHGGGSQNITAVKYAPMNVELSSLMEHYVLLGEKHIKNIEKFMSYWNLEGKETLLSPKARLVMMPKKEAERNFGYDIMLGEESADHVIMAVWTLGGDLEKKSMELMSANGDRMMGFLLDVAGSIALYNMHDVLIEWIRSELAAPNNKFITKEFYPGQNDVILDMMEKIELLGCTERTIEVAAHGSPMFHPMKTQCSFVGISSTPLDVSLSVLPCSPCSDKKCLYYQLGGCHMQVLANSDKAKGNKNEPQQV